ncbi:unnamed protein product [Phytophthora lilii]|uniref:Unnamed protein product n=1 Tax=Phytophthora lilii TaxID=2077276 RepID=A0A9W6YDX5_9STRA|nr:unnamed protein product [Phytophthora lilii]
MAAYAEAIRLCYNIEDESTEAILTSKLRKLQRHADAMAHVELQVAERATDDPESERSQLKAAFEGLAGADGFLNKDQLQPLAEKLGIHDPLSNSEVDSIWRQLQSCGRNAQNDSQTPASTMISFETLWRWWMSDSVNDYMRDHTSL